jgi:hypothetical protein
MVVFERGLRLLIPGLRGPFDLRPFVERDLIICHEGHFGTGFIRAASHFMKGVQPRIDDREQDHGRGDRSRDEPGLPHNAEIV